MSEFLTRLGSAVPHQQAAWLMRLSQITLRVSRNFAWPVLVLYFLAPELVPHNEVSLLWKSFYYGSSLLLLCVGLYIRLWSQGYFKNDQFVLDGPYRYVRNPVEISNLICFFAGFLFLRAPWWYTTFSLVLAFVWLSSNALAYERALYLKMGAHFLHYKKRVMRWIPSQLPEVNKSDTRFSFQRAAKEERFGILWLACFLVVAALRFQLLKLF
jgi:protein-S-isoprenylcysteine O-methyltransferase Ste14